MTALAQDKKPVFKGNPKSMSVPVEEATLIYEGAIVAVNAAGLLVPAADSSGLRVVGVAAHRADNSDGADGAINCQVLYGCPFEFANSNVDQTHVGRAVYAADDQTIEHTSANGIVCGVLTKFTSSALCEVDIDPFIGASVSAPTLLETVTSGALNVNAATSLISVTGTQAYTLGAGPAVGFRKRIECSVAASIPAGTLTIADAAGSEQTSWVFNAVGQAIELVWYADGWHHVAVTTAGAATPAAASTLNPLVAFNNIAVDGTDDWILPSGAAPGQTVSFHVSQADNIPVGTISGLFYDEDGSADGVDIQFNAVADMATVRWNGIRWVLTGHTSAAIA